MIHVGNLYYQYDVNGNVTCKQDGSFESNGDDVKYHKISEEVDAGRGRTIDAGTYTRTLLNKSGSYNEAISITGNGVVVIQMQRLQKVLLRNMQTENDLIVPDVKSLI